jgi:hypothetical protein
MQFEVEYGHVWYENKVKTTKGIHLLNLLGENNFEGVQKPSQKDHLPINAPCVEMLTWRNQKKVQGFGLACSFLRKVRSDHLIQGVSKSSGGVKGHGCRGKWCQSVSCSRVFPCAFKI